MENNFAEVVEDMINSLHITSEDAFISLKDEILFSSKDDKAHIFVLKFGEEDSKDYKDTVSKCI